MLVPMAGFVAYNQVATTYTADKAHSDIGFKVRHLGISNVKGEFTDYTASVTMDGEDLNTIQAEATVQVGSISTGIDRRDNHLKSDDFFNAEQFPTLTFKSKGVRNIKGDSFELVGDLTIRDVTKEVVLEAEFLGAGQMMETKKVGFEAQTVINRFDYNLKWDNLTEAGGFVVGEEVTILLELELDAK
ncbi:MAG: YceI family protein [Rhodothermales bacterium]